MRAWLDRIQGARSVHKKWSFYVNLEFRNGEIWRRELDWLEFGEVEDRENEGEERTLMSCA